MKIFYIRCFDKGHWIVFFTLVINKDTSQMLSSQVSGLGLGFTFSPTEARLTEYRSIAYVCMRGSREGRGRGRGFGPLEITSGFSCPS